MSEPVIQFQQAAVQAGGRTLIDDITLTIQRGERIAIVGHNGAGKSTLLKAMSGAVKPVRGEAMVLGKALHQTLGAAELRRLRTMVGQVFQGLHLVQRLTVLENVLLGSLARHRSWLTWARIFPQQERQAAHAALQAVGLIGKSHLRADRLSGGERQKTAIARMLLQAPQIILADEPTAALDPLASAEIATILSSLAKSRGGTLVSVVHDPGLLPVLAERVIGMRDGRIVFDLPIASVNDSVLAQLYGNSQRQDDWVSRLRHTRLPLGESL